MSSVFKSCLYSRNPNGFKNCVKRFYSDKLLPASDYIAWNPEIPVKIRLEEKGPGSYPPILVQTMLRNTVEKYGKNRAIVSCDGKIDWTYEQYYEEVKNVAKGQKISKGNFGVINSENCLIKYLNKGILLY